MRGQTLKIPSLNKPESIIICLLILTSGFAALSWEVIWQIKSALALGVSAWGTAITLAVMMGGMGLGGFVMGNALHDASPARAVRLYGSLELLIGIAGLLLNTAFLYLEKLDTWAYAMAPASISLFYIIGIATVLGVPALCMGATLPVFGLISKQFRVPIAKLYSLNTLGSSAGALAVAMLLIPIFGITRTIWVIAAVNIMVGVSAMLLASGNHASTGEEPESQPMTSDDSLAKTLFIVFITGFTTFTLEVAWFRSLENLLPNTTDIFAILLACTLAALGLAAKKVPLLKQKTNLPGTQMCLAGLLILLVTPILERLGNFSIYSKQIVAMHADTLALNARNTEHLLLHADTFSPNLYACVHYIFSFLVTFFMIYMILVPPMRYLGTAFPWLLDKQHSSRTMGKLYAVNTLAAIAGSICTAWILLPIIGFAKTAWLAGVLVLLTGIAIMPGQLKRVIWTVLGASALYIAIISETGIGKTHVLGFFATDENGRPGKVLEFFEGPEATASAIEYIDGSRVLLVNSTLAALESGRVYRRSAHYMPWMGHLPMLLQRNPMKALVICFGTGQTANAVRKENPQQLDIVDINPNIFKLAHEFKSNEGVLNDPRVKTFVMDGRSYMRRTRKMYDVITLEPMPPGTVGVNTLYSKEFYELARKRLQPGGVIAQWLPFNGIAPQYAASIARTFQEAFPNAILWLDLESLTGILLGTNDTSSIPAYGWPGFARTHIARDLSQEKIEQYVALDAAELKRFGAYGQVISDDNQLLSYGKILYATGMIEANFELLHRINNKIAIPDIRHPYL